MVVLRQPIEQLSGWVAPVRWICSTRLPSAALFAIMPIKWTYRPPHCTAHHFQCLKCFLCALVCLCLCHLSGRLMCCTTFGSNVFNDLKIFNDCGKSGGIWNEVRMYNVRNALLWAKRVSLKCITRPLIKGRKMWIVHIEVRRALVDHLILIEAFYCAQLRLLLAPPWLKVD